MFTPGQKVRFVDADAHERSSEFYPPVGSIGIVVETDPDDMALVDWGANSGVWGRLNDGYYWWAMNRMLEAADAES